MFARSSASVSNSLADACELVVELGQHLLVDVLHGDRDAGGRVVGEIVGNLPGLADAGADQGRLDLLDEPSRAELDDRVRLRLAAGALQVDDEGVAVPGRAVVRRERARQRSGARPRAPDPRAPAAPRPPDEAPRASSSRRSQASAAPRSWPRTTSPPCRSSATRSRTPGATQDAIACVPPPTRTSR